MEYKNYYKIRGVFKSAIKDGIKKQCRTLACKYHPDVNPGDKTSQAQFAEINEARKVVAYPEKKNKE